MSIATPLLVIEQPCEEVVGWANQQLADAGLQVLRTFDLQAARLAHDDCACPYHGSLQCDCQIVILLVYGEESQPASLVAHGRQGCTRISLVDIPEQRPNSHLEHL